MAFQKSRWIAAAPGLAVAGFIIVSVTQSACSSAPMESPTDEVHEELRCADGSQRLTVPSRGDSCCVPDGAGALSCTRFGDPGVGTPCTTPGARKSGERSRIVKDTCVRESCNGDRNAEAYVASADVEIGSLVCARSAQGYAWRWDGGPSGIRATQSCVAVGPLYCGYEGYGYGYGYGYGHGYGYGYGGGSTYGGYEGYGGGGPVQREVIPNRIECTRNGHIEPCALTTP